MALLSISKHLAAFAFLIFLLKTSFAASNSSFSLTKFNKGPNFDSIIALYGDAEVVNDGSAEAVKGGSAVQLTNSVSSSGGRAMYKKSLKLGEGKPQKSLSFSTNFSFSMSTGNGDGFAFVMVPKGFNLSLFGNSSFGLSLGYGKSKFKVVVVKFNGLRDGKVHVGIDVGSYVSAKVSNASGKNLTAISGNKLLAWIDYEAGSNRLEVRLGQFGHSRPADPLLWYPIALLKMWEHEEVFVGLSAMNRNSSQTCSVYSWSFEQRHVPHWMHSQPLDPNVFAKNLKPLTVESKRECVRMEFAAMFLGIACGALTSGLVMYLWSVFGNRRPVVPEEYAEQPKEFEYKKMKVAVDNKAIEDGKQQMF